MSDDDADEPRWFPPELRDHLSAIVAHAGFQFCWLSLIIALPSFVTSAGWWTVTGMIVGFVTAVVGQAVVRWSCTPYRSLGLGVPVSTALFVGLGVHLTCGTYGAVEAFLIWFGSFGGVLASGRYPTPAGGLRPDLQRTLTGYSWVFGGLIGVQCLGVFAAMMARVTGNPLFTSDAVATVLKWYFFGVSALLCVWCWLRLFRPFFELCCEAVFRVLYRIRATGPGVKQVPPVGPVLVIANHAAWFDPLFVAEFVNRPITPMMTESFYKIWFLRPILRHVFHVIVVPERPLRREAPELQQAIDALGRGECVVLFPEGYLRRKEEVPLRRFGQGVWHILHAQPDTPVVACWIEGSWGSTFSWRNGPPVKGKRLDFRRPIGVGVASPEAVPADVLTDQLATRLHLMNRVSAARAHLGLPALPPFELLHADDPA